MFVLDGFAGLAVLVLGGPAVRIGLDGAPAAAVLVVFPPPIWVERFPILGFPAICFPNLREAASLPCRRDIVLADRPIPSSGGDERET